MHWMKTGVTFKSILNFIPYKTKEAGWRLKHAEKRGKYLFLISPKSALIRFFAVL